MIYNTLYIYIRASAALGHGKKTVTDIYIKFDMRKVDAANRRIIDLINGKK